MERMNRQELFGTLAGLQVICAFFVILVLIWFPGVNEIATKILKTNLVIFMACVFFYIGVDEE
jgi:hypothetical protein